jgi:hypothetical protein
MFLQMKQKIKETSFYYDLCYHCRPRLGKRSVGRPQARCSDDLRRTTGGSWIRVAGDRARWREVGEGYVQQWNSPLSSSSSSAYYRVG